jgi:hypothetical protein
MFAKIGSMEGILTFISVFGFHVLLCVDILTEVSYPFVKFITVNIFIITRNKQYILLHKLYWECKL